MALSNALIECFFAAMRQWLQRSSKPLSMYQLSAKHMTHRCKVAHDKKLLASGSKADKSRRRTRPVWIHAKRSRVRHKTLTNAIHVFMKSRFARPRTEYNQSKEEKRQEMIRRWNLWRATSFEERKAWKKVASSQRACSSALKTPLDKYLAEHGEELHVPAGLFGSTGPWPISIAEIEDKMKVKGFMTDGCELV